MGVPELSDTFSAVDRFLEVRGVRGLWVFVLGNRLTAVVTMAVSLQIAVGSALEASGMGDICLGVMFVLGYPTTLGAQLMFGRCLQDIRGDLRALAAVSERLQLGSRTDLQRTARVVRTAIAMWVGFTCSVTLSVVMPSLIGVLHVRVWPQLSGVAFVLYCFPYNLAITAVVCSIYGLLLMTQGVGLACCGLLEEIGARVQDGDSAELVEAVRAHQDLVRVVWRMRDRQQTALAPGVLNMTLLPLISALSYLAGSAITLLQAVLIVTSMSALYLICATTDRVICAGQEVAWRAYSRDWLSPTSATSERALLLLLINLAQNKTLDFRADGFGAFSTASYMAVMKTWYTYLQMLVGISNKQVTS